MKISITIKGLIFMSLGGYIEGEGEIKNREKTDKVIEDLIRYLGDDTALTVIDGKLSLVEIEKDQITNTPTITQ